MYKRIRNSVKAYIFIPLFVAIIVAFGFFIGSLSRRLGGKIEPRRHTLINGIVIGAILLGAIGMFQPWVLAAYRVGFYMVLVGTLTFTAWSHVPPKASEQALQSKR